MEPRGGEWCSQGPTSLCRYHTFSRSTRAGIQECSIHSFSIILFIRFLPSFFPRLLPFPPPLLPPRAFQAPSYGPTVYATISTSAFHNGVPGGSAMSTCIPFKCGPDNPCLSFGTCVSEETGICECPTGFGGADCGKALCGSVLEENTARPLKEDDSTCVCKDGFTGIKYAFTLT